MLEHIIENVLLVFALEIGAAVSGTIYLNGLNHSSRDSRLIVYYLWIVVIVEFVGLYPAIAYYSDYTKLGFTEGTKFERNFWWFNLYQIVKIVLLSYFFIDQFVSNHKRKVFYTVSWIIALSCIINYIFSDNFYKQFSSYSAIVGALYLILLILIYHVELMKSEKILQFYKSPVFYVSIGMLLWNAIVTPLFIYNKYFTLASPDFVNLHTMTLRFTNVFLYGFIILGFLVSHKKSKEKRNMENGGEII